MLTFYDEKGLFTFYRQQHEMEDELARKRELLILNGSLSAADIQALHDKSKSRNNNNKKSILQQKQSGAPKSKRNGKGQRHKRHRSELGERQEPSEEQSELQNQRKMRPSKSKQYQKQGSPKKQHFQQHDPISEYYRVVEQRPLDLLNSLPIQQSPNVGEYRKMKLYSHKLKQLRAASPRSSLEGQSYSIPESLLKKSAFDPSPMQQNHSTLLSNNSYNNGVEFHMFPVYSESISTKLPALYPNNPTNKSQLNEQASLMLKKGELDKLFHIFRSRKDKDANNSSMLSDKSSGPKRYISKSLEPLMKDAASKNVSVVELPRVKVQPHGNWDFMRSNLNQRYRTNI